MCGSCHTEFEVGSTRPAARRHLLQLPPVLHGQADDRRHGRPGRALPEASRAFGADLSRAASPECDGDRPTAARRRQTDVWRADYGGQALLEGVLMRGRDAIGVAVAAPDGSIVRAAEPLNSVLHRNRFARAPFFRGIVVLYETLVVGTRWLMRSGSVQAAGEGVEMGRGAIALTLSSRSASRSGCSCCCRCSSPRPPRTRAIGPGQASHPAPRRGLIRVGIFIGYLLDRQPLRRDPRASSSTTAPST